jgi:hypothetical protein
MQDSLAAGQRLATALQADDLQLLLLLAPGTDINGTALLDGLQQVLGDAVPVVGGMAADDGRFCQTFTLHQSGWSDHQLVAVGLYGRQLQVGHGSCGGWTTFGPARQVSRCQQNILYELDGAPALEVYKRYLGEYASGLPGSGLLFPFAMLGHTGEDQGCDSHHSGRERTGRQPDPGRRTGQRQPAEADACRHRQPGTWRGTVRL